MSKRDPHIFIEDIREAIEKIERYTAGLHLETFLSDDKTIDAVIRNLEIIGETVRQLPDDFKAAYQDFPWPRMAGLRNRIVHEYFGLDLEIIWQVVKKDLPELKKKIQFIQKAD